MGDIYPLVLSVFICATISLLGCTVRRVLYTLDAPPYTDSGFQYLSPDWSAPTHYPIYVNTVYVCVFLAGTLYLILSNAFRWIILRRMCFLATLAQIIYFVQLSVTRFPDPNPDVHERKMLFDMYHIMYVICFLVVQFYEYSAVIRGVYLPATLFGLWLLIPTHMFYTIDILTAVFSVLCVFFIYHWYVRNTVAISKRWWLVWFESDALEFLLKEDDIYHRKLIKLVGTQLGANNNIAPPANGQQSAATTAPTTPQVPSVGSLDHIPSLQFFSSGTVEHSIKLEIPRHLNNPLHLLRERAATNGVGAGAASDNVLAAGLVVPGTASSDESMASRHGSPHQGPRSGSGFDGRGGAGAGGGEISNAALPPSAHAAAAAAAPAGSGGELPSNNEGYGTSNTSTTNAAANNAINNAETGSSHNAPSTPHNEFARQQQEASPSDPHTFDAVSALFNPFRSPSFIDHKIKADVFQRAEERLVRFVRATYTERQKTIHVWGTAAMGVGLAIVAGLANLGAVQITDVERPIGVPLPRDFIFELLPKVWDHTADVMVYTLMAFTAALILSRPERFTIFRRVGTLYFCIMILRIFTVTATFPVDPSPLCKFRQHPPGTTCGDLIFSGHTVALLLASLVWSDYFDNNKIKNVYVIAFVWCYTMVALLMVILSKLHYTRDVITASVVVTMFYHMWQVSVFLRPDVLLRHSWLRWFELDQYIQLEQAGKYSVQEDVIGVDVAADEEVAHPSSSAPPPPVVISTSPADGGAASGGNNNTENTAPAQHEVETAGNMSPASA